MHVLGISIDFVDPSDFGHPATQFYGLIATMTTISLGLWAVVGLTTVVRFLACSVLYRSRGQDRTALERVPAQNGTG